MVMLRTVICFSFIVNDFTTNESVFNIYFSRILHPTPKKIGKTFKVTHVFIS